MKKNITVVVGMSGGVDSSVSALLLKKQGYNVIGLFMQNWDTILNNDFLGHKKDGKICDPQQDYLDAKNVANKLNIQLYRVEFIKEYWEYVFKYFLNEYKNGRTPNPDILCNKFIKFDYFLKYAIKKFKCDFIAMGHYANIKRNKNNYFLEMAKDENKDQTYFLCYLNQKQLSKTIFPIGKLKKEEVRKIAVKNKLITANKKDSTGICFIGERKFKDFLLNYLPAKKGNIVDIKTKEIIGEHIGVMYYTIGQNNNLNLGGNKTKYFVCSKDIKNNILYVIDETNKEKYLLTKFAIVEKINWINREPLLNKTIKVRFRHRQKLINCKIIQKKQGKIVIEYDKTLSVTPGQFAVFYDKNICLGGGIINKTKDKCIII